MLTVRVMASICSILTLAVAALIVLTLIATDRSRERTACYRTAVAIEGCPHPSWWENLLP